MKRSCLLLVSGAISIFGIAPSAFAEPVTRNTEFSVTVNPYLNVTLSSNDVHLPITPSSGGTFGSTYFTATSSTNNALGYSLNLSIKDTNTEQAVLTTNLTSNTINVNDGTKPVIPTFSTNDVLTSAQFSASTSADHLNHWAMSLDDTDHYQKVLSESTIATSDEPIADDVTTLNLATKLDLLTPPGSYSAYFNFEIVANVYTPDSPGTTGGSIDEAGGDNAGRTFPANSLLRSFELAYNAAGKPIYVEDSTVTGPIPGWRPMTDEDQATIGGKEVRFAMQDIGLTFEESGTAHNVCEWASPTEVRAGTGWYLDEAYVMDIRDGKSYWITKLADGKCWMTQNLALELDAGTIYTNNDTDLGWNGSGYSSASWTPLRSTSNGYAAAATASKVSGWQDNKAEPHSTRGYANYNSFPSNHEHPGIVYNWSAAVASNDTSAYNPTTAGAAQIASSSVCPAYWRLPIIADQNYSSSSTIDEFEFINNTYNNGSTSSTYDLTQLPVYLKNNNYTVSSTGYFGGSNGAYWSSVPKDGDNAYSFKLSSSSIDTHFYSSRSEGMAIRCVAR